MTFDIDAAIAGRFVKASVENKWEDFAPSMAQAYVTKPKSKTYLHIGPDSYDPTRVTGEDNTADHNDKPNTLYGSEFIPEGEAQEADSPIMKKIRTYSDWDRFVQEGWRDKAYDTGFTYELNPEARVYNFRGLNDLKKMPMKYWKPDAMAILNKRFPGWYYPSNRARADVIWDQIIDEIETGKISVDDESVPLMLNYGQLAKDYDVLDFGNAYGQSSVLNGGKLTPAFKRVRDGRINALGRYNLPIFDAGQSIVFNPDMVTNVTPWTRPLNKSQRDEAAITLDIDQAMEVASPTSDTFDIQVTTKPRPDNRRR